MLCDIKLRQMAAEMRQAKVTGSVCCFYVYDNKHLVGRFPRSTCASSNVLWEMEFQFMVANGCCLTF